MKSLMQELKAEIRKDKQAIVAFLFGSKARGEKGRDVDICLVLDRKYSVLEMSRKRASYSALPADIHVYQQLPLYIRQRILKEGKIIYCANEELLYDIAFLTIKEFDTYEKAYTTYLDAMEAAA